MIEAPYLTPNSRENYNNLPCFRRHSFSSVLGRRHPGLIRLELMSGAAKWVLFSGFQLLDKPESL
jgi:hypothetical protein